MFSSIFQTVLVLLSTIVLHSAFAQDLEQLARQNCEVSDRFIDGTCTNPSNPLYGSADRPTFSYVNGHTSAVFSSRGRPGAREISNAISDQQELVFNDRNLNELVVFFGQFLDHDLVQSSSGTESIPISVPATDPNIPERGSLPFLRHRRAPVSPSSSNVRAINFVSQIIDLSSVYGSSEERETALRQFSEGRLKISAGNLLPLNTEGIENEPIPTEDFFIAGDLRSNETPMLTVLHTIWVREHNNIIDELLENRTFNRLDDEGLFQLARKINIAQFQKVVYEEFFPAIVGNQLPNYRGFDPSVDPTVSNIFSTAAFRVGHTMVGNGVQILEGSSRTVIPFMQMFFRDQSLIRGRGIEPFLRGAMTTRAQEVDNMVVDALRNFLFENVEVFDVFDLISTNIQRGRDHNLPSYNEIRELFGIPLATSFADISSDPELQQKFASVYASVDDVDAWPGLVSEDHVRGSSLGRTMKAVWEAEFTRLRDGDQFFFLRTGQIRSATRQLRRVRVLTNRNRPIFRDILLRNTNLSPSQVPGRPFLV